MTELLTLSTVGLTTDTTNNLLPVDSIIESVEARVTTTITTTTNWAVGDATTGARFCAANATLTAGTTSSCLKHQQGSVATDAAGPVQIGGREGPHHLHRRESRRRRDPHHRFLPALHRADELRRIRMSLIKKICHRRHGVRDRRDPVDRARGAREHHAYQSGDARGERRRRREQSARRGERGAHLSRLQGACAWSTPWATPARTAKS
jgi:hypothetical protein